MKVVQLTWYVFSRHELCRLSMHLFRFILASIAELRHYARSVPSDGFKKLKSLLKDLRRGTCQSNSQGDCIFDGLGSTLPLVCLSLVLQLKFGCEMLTGKHGMRCVTY